MKLTNSSPTPCLCGRTSSPVWLEMDYEVPGLRGWVHLCLDCLVEIQGHVRAVPLAEHERIIGAFKTQVAELKARVGELTSYETDAQRLREQLDAIQPQLDQHAAEVLGLQQAMGEEQRKREEAEQRAAGNITIRGFEDSLAQAVERGWSEHKPKRKAAAA